MAERRTVGLALIASAMLMTAILLAEAVSSSRPVSAPVTSSTTTGGFGGSAFPATGPTPGAPSTAWGTSTPSPAEAAILAGQATNRAILEKVAATRTPWPTSTPRAYRSPTPSPSPTADAGTGGWWRVGG